MASDIPNSTRLLTLALALLVGGSSAAMQYLALKENEGDRILHQADVSRTVLGLIPLFLRLAGWRPTRSQPAKVIPAWVHIVSAVGHLGAGAIELSLALRRSRS